MKKIKLQFMVNPDELKSKAYVPDAVLIKFIKPEYLCVEGILGESGRKLIKKCSFYFTRKLAQKYVDNGWAVKK